MFKSSHRDRKPVIVIMDTRNMQLLIFQRTVRATKEFDIKLGNKYWDLSDWQNQDEELKIIFAINC